MPIHYDSGRKDTGRTDKYSDETPKKDYQDYKSDYPTDKETARKEAREITLKIKAPHFIGKKSVEAKKQELTSHIQSYQETFNNAEVKVWKNKFKELTEALG